MNNLMIDLETMGKKPNAPVVSIGAVFFDPQSGEIGPEFYTPLALKAQWNKVPFLMAIPFYGG